MAQSQLQRASFSQTVFDALPIYAQTAKSLQGPWTTRPEIEPIRAVRSTGKPAKADFMRRHGRMYPAGSASRADRDTLDLGGLYVRIVMSYGLQYQPLWWGVVQDTERRIYGTAPVDTGDQMYVAYDLKQLLERIHIDKSYVQDSTDTSAYRTVDTVFDFNGSQNFGRQLWKNRSATKTENASTGQSSYLFSDDIDTATYWTNADIIEYLCAWFSPGGFNIAATGQLQDTLTYVTRNRLRGLTLIQAFNHLADHRRGVAWDLRPEELSFGSKNSKPTINLVIFSTLGDAISYGDVVVPANAEQINFYLQNDSIFEKHRVIDSTGNVYDRVIVSGQPVTVAFSPSYDNELLEAGWSSAEETAYKAVSLADAASNDAERKTDKYERVYQVHRIKRDWEWKYLVETIQDGPGANSNCANCDFSQPNAVFDDLLYCNNLSSPFYNTSVEATHVCDFWEGDAIGNTITTEYAVCPTVDDNGVVDAKTPVNGVTRGKSFERSLPIIKTPSATSTEPEYLEPFGVVSIGGTYYQLDALNDGTNSENVGLRMHDGELAIVCKPTVNHVLGSGSFSAATHGPTNNDPIADYNNLAFTVAVKGDERLQVVATSATYQDKESPKTLYIDVDDAETWLVLPKTILGVTNGALVTTDDETVLTVRDDSDRLRRIAALALAFYSRRRYALDITARTITYPAKPGQYVRDVYVSGDSDAAGSVVSSITWDFQAGTTNLQTGFINIDVNAFDIPNMSDARAVGREIREIRRDVWELQRHTGNLSVRSGSGGGGSSSSLADANWLYTRGDG
jgi:hypothetical protein